MFLSARLRILTLIWIIERGAQESIMPLIWIIERGAQESIMPLASFLPEVDLGVSLNLRFYSR